MKTSKKHNRNRSLRIESLEERELLSVNPFNPVPEPDSLSYELSNEPNSLSYELSNEPDCVSPAFTADSVAENAPPAGYNAYEWNLVESQGLTDYATWQNGRLIEIGVPYKKLMGDLDLSDCTYLRVLGCSGNQLTSLDVSGCTELRILECSNNQLTSLNVSGCTKLGTLDCSDNPLTSLNISGYTELQYLDCHDNLLTSLNVSGCSELRILHCYGNQLISLNVSDLSNLFWLDCPANQLTSLNISGCTVLQNLNCNSNQLSSLNISGFVNLLSLVCYDNQLTSLDVSGLSGIGYLSCEGNQLTSLNLNDTSFFGYTTVERTDGYFDGTYEYAYTYPDGTTRQVNADAKTQIVFDTTTTVGTPTNFKAVQSGKNVVLTWSAASNAATYRIGRWNDVTKKWVDLSKACTNLTLTNNNVTPGTHKYLLRAYNGTSYSNSVTVSIDVKGTVTVGTPTNFKAVQNGKNVVLTWSAASNATTYRIGRWNDVTGKWVDLSKACTNLTLTNNNVTPGTHKYLLRAYNGTSYGNSVTVSIDVKETMVAVGTPTNFKAVQNGKNVVLTWSAASNAATYRIGRWNDVTKKWVDLSKACTKLTLTNNNVTPGTHKYLLRAYNGTSYGNSVTVTIDVKETTAVGTPTNFKAVQSGKNVVLTWSAASNAATYRIGRWNDVTKKWVDLSKACTNLTLINNNVTPGTHKYLLRAYNGTAYGNSVTVSINVKETTAVGTPTNLKAEPLASRNVNLTWDAVASATHYQIFWKNTTSGKMVGFGTTEMTSFKTTRVPNGSNTFYVYAWADDVRSKSSATVTTTVGSNVPDGYNAYEWNLVQSQGLEDCATWEDGRLVRIYANNAGLKGALNLSDCTNLAYLYCNNNQLTSLDVSDCISLCSMECNNNQLASLNVSGCYGLGGLEASNNQLTSLVADLNLNYLDVSNNQLTSLDVSNYWQWFLNVSGNNLTSLDVSGCPNLQVLYCFSNGGLTSLNLNGSGFAGYTAVEQSESDLGTTHTYTYPDGTERTLIADEGLTVVFAAAGASTNFKAALSPLEAVFAEYAEV